MPLELTYYLIAHDIRNSFDFFEEAFGCDIEEFRKILWMPETFIIYRRMYDENLRKRLAERYTQHSADDCNLANEWWAKFPALPPEKLEIAKGIIAMNKFKDEDITCDDEDVKEVLCHAVLDIIKQRELLGAVFGGELDGTDGDCSNLCAP